MLFELPDDQILYQALLDRNAEYEGRAYVGVSSTGIFCRLTCPARKPKPQNCSFYSAISDCIRAGYRPCKRCRPLDLQTISDPWVNKLLAEFENRPDHRWREADLQKLGLEPSTVRRHFKKQFGMTFLEMARQRRLRRAFDTMAHGGKVIDAQLEANFDSPSAFRSAFARLLGRAPGRFDSGTGLLVDWIETALGDMISICDHQRLYLLQFVDSRFLKSRAQQLEKKFEKPLSIGATAMSEKLKSELSAFFEGRSGEFSVEVGFLGTDFEQKVWRGLMTIPAGSTRSYAQIAKQIGHPKAVRAVGRANGANPIALIVPCHRVIGADGSLTGYGGGLWRKQKLLEIECNYRKAKN